MEDGRKNFLLAKLPLCQRSSAKEHVTKADEQFSCHFHFFTGKSGKLFRVFSQDWAATCL